MMHLARRRLPLRCPWYRVSLSQAPSTGSLRSLDCHSWHCSPTRVWPSAPTSAAPSGYGAAVERPWFRGGCLVTGLEAAEAKATVIRYDEVELDVA
jgi:hypothetical protein